nr:endochitinase A-like [Onthophagus taurus]
MKQLIFLAYFGLAVFAKPSHHHHHHHPLADIYPIHPGVGAIYKGPNSETIIKGPDGSVITAEADGGSIGVDGHSAAAEAVSHVAVETINHGVGLGHQAVSASAGAYVQTNSIAPAPVIVAKAPAPVVVAEPVVLVQDNRDVASLDGPSGSILRHGEDAIISGPSSTTYKGGKHVIDVPNIEVQASVVGASGPGYVHGPVVAPTPIISPVHGPIVSPVPVVSPVPSVSPFPIVSSGPVVETIVSSTPGPILINPPPRPLRPRPVLVDTTHPFKPLSSPVSVLVDNTHLAGSTLGTSSVLVDNSQILRNEVVVSSPGPILHDTSAISIHNEVVPQVVVSSTPSPVLSATPIVVAPSKTIVAAPTVELSPPSVGIYSTPASHIVGHANEEALSAIIAKNAEAEQSYLSALRYAGYEKALAAEAERKSLAAAIASGAYSGHGIAEHSINPVVSQGNHIITGGIVSSTAAPVIVSSTPAPILVTSTPAHGEVVGLGHEIVSVGPQVYQENGIVSVTPKPDVIVSRPTAILAPHPPPALGQIIVQNERVSSASKSSEHSSSVKSSSSTISGPAVLGGPHGYRLPAGPPLGYQSDYSQWRQSVSKQAYHEEESGYSVQKGLLH